MEFGEPCPWAGEGPGRLTPVKGLDPGNSFPPSRRSFSSAFPLSSPSSAFPVLHSIFSSSLLRSRSCSPLPPVSPHPLPFWCRHFSAALGGSESSAQREFRESRAGLPRIARSAGRPPCASGRPRGRRGRAGLTRLAGPAECAPEGRRGGSLSGPGAGQPRSQGSSEPQ